MDPRDRSNKGAVRTTGTEAETPAAVRADTSTGREGEGAVQHFAARNLPNGGFYQRARERGQVSATQAAQRARERYMQVGAEEYQRGGDDGPRTSPDASKTEPRGFFDRARDVRAHERRGEHASQFDPHDRKRAEAFGRSGRGFEGGARREGDYRPDNTFRGGHPYEHYEQHQNDQPSDGAVRKRRP